MKIFFADEAIVVLIDHVKRLSVIIMLDTWRLWLKISIMSNGLLDLFKFLDLGLVEHGEDIASCTGRPLLGSLLACFSWSLINSEVKHYNLLVFLGGSKKAAVNWSTVYRGIKFDGFQITYRYILHPNYKHRLGMWVENRGYKVILSYNS